LKLFLIAADKKGEQPGKGKAEKEETQPSHSKDTQKEDTDPVEGMSENLSFS
jgi:hypothetical protein